MVDLVALAISHSLLALAAWRLMLTDALDNEPAPRQAEGEGAGND